MRYKQFKNAGVEVSSLAVGTWAIGGQNYGAVDRNDSIKAIRAKVDVPLVLHGCSDIPEEQLKEAVNLGMSKFNIATEYFRAMYRAMEADIKSQKFDGDGVGLMFDIREAMIDFVVKKIRLLNPNKFSI